MYPIKETKELLIGLNELSLLLIDRLKDGIGMDDMTAIWAKLRDDEEFKAKIEAAYKDANKIPAEVKDIDLAEGLDLVQAQIAYIPKIIEKLKK